MTTISDSLPAEEIVESSKTQDASTAGDEASLFPLALVPFEQYMLTDERPGYAMTFIVRVELEGVPDRLALETAFQDAQNRHPLVRSRIARRRRKHWWVPVESPPVALHWSRGASEPTWPLGEPLDIRRSAGIQGFIHCFQKESVLVLHFHHAVCDGIGAMRFLGDLLAYYGRQTASADMMPTLLPVSAASLPYRSMFDIRLPAPVSRWTAFSSTIRETWKVFSRRPQVLENRNRPPIEMQRAGAIMPVAELDRDMYRRFCARAGELGVTANDLMLRDIFLTAREWNISHGRRRSRGWLRVTMPTSLRGKRDARMPATNTLGYALVTRHTDECDNPAELLKAIAADTDAIRKWSLGVLFVESLRTASRLPGLMWLGSRLGRRFSTLVLSNLGDPTRRFRARFPRIEGKIRAGDLTVNRITGVPPIRPGTHAALALFSYPDTCSIALHADPRWFSPQDARDFLERYRKRLEQSAEPSGARRECVRT